MSSYGGPSKQSNGSGFSRMHNRRYASYSIASTLYWWSHGPVLSSSLRSRTSHSYRSSNHPSSSSFCNPRRYSCAHSTSAAASGGLSSGWPHATANRLFGSASRSTLRDSRKNGSTCIHRCRSCRSSSAATPRFSSSRTASVGFACQTGSYAKGRRSSISGRSHASSHQKGLGKCGCSGYASGPRSAVHSTSWFHAGRPLKCHRRRSSYWCAGTATNLFLYSS